MAKEANPGLIAVAAAAEVSAMTVSRVLRNSPQVSSSTRQRVLQAAAKLGYRPDPQIARLMAQVRNYRRRRIESVIAVVRDDIPEDELHDPAYQYVSLHDIRRRAEQHGYRAEEFFLGRGGLTAKRLNHILSSRGIDGLIVSPQSSQNIGTQLDYSRFAAATFGYGIQQPALHRASTNMTRGILEATKQLAARGYRRIGLAVTQWVDARSDHTYSGAMLNFQQTLPAKQRVPLLLFPENNLFRESGIFCAWVKKHRPDAIISFDAQVPDWLTKRLGLRIPEDVGLVAHDWSEQMTGFAGINHRRPHVASAAVDLVATQLMQNERGVPEVPRQILIPPAWVEGSSIRATGAMA
jgi:DNA-binding LacI/PurR family transcriptional regulator